MSVLFDSHAHLDGLKDDAGVAAMIERATAAGVGHILAVGGWPEANGRAVESARRFPGIVRAAVGLERDQAVRFTDNPDALKSDVEAIGCLARAGMADDAVVALGEIGLDFHYTPETADAQIRLFRAQLDLAAGLRLPAIVHSREADEATLAELERHCRNWPGDPGRIGVLHCFTGSREFAMAVLDLGYFISFSGIITFSNARELREVAAGIPDERLLIETDSPFLAPAPYRGKPNEPAYLARVAAGLAEARGCPVGHVAGITTRNALLLFGPAG